MSQVPILPDDLIAAYDALALRLGRECSAHEITRARLERSERDLAALREELRVEMERVQAEIDAMGRADDG